MKNLKVAVKLLIGFGIVVALMLIVGITSMFTLNDLNDGYVEAIDQHGLPLADAGTMLEAVHSMRAEMRGCMLFSGNIERIKPFEAEWQLWANTFDSISPIYYKTIVNPEVKKLYEETMDIFKNQTKPGMKGIIEDAKKGVPIPDMVKQMSEVVKPTADKVGDNLKECMNGKKVNLDKAEHHGKADAASVNVLMIVLIIVGVVISVFFGIYISGQISKPLQHTVKMLQEISSGHLSMRLRMNQTDEVGLMATAMDKFADDMQNIVIGTMKKISEGDLSMKIESKDPQDEIGAALKGTIDALHALIIDDGGKVLQAAANKDLTQRLTREYKGDYATMKENINTVVKNLDDALSQVAEGVMQVTSASGEISSGAQNLAEGANEQASSLEEVSSSLEEMSSMTKQNADNSNQAKILASEARTAANEGDASMKKMADAIQQIKTSSDNTAKIIKTIDDIAFQTNLLALNAAVEAARAGEAGKGFAVVAEEVRNLAMRSAEAAKNTANMIEESVKNSEGGVRITEEVAKSLGKIVDRASKVGDLIAEIAAASNEQSLGIEQVNTAVAQMNQVTQQNAANSEESASASEELSSQAAELANMVAAFKLSAGGSKSGGGYNNVRRSLPPPAAHKAPHAAITDKRGGGSAAPSTPTKTIKALKPEDVIPLDDDELMEF